MMPKVCLIISLILTLPLGLGSAAKAAEQIQFDKADLFVQVNASDGDASLHLALDGEAWKPLKLLAPHGRKILNVKGKGKLRSLGLTGLSTESDAPGFDEVPLDEFKSKFPAGMYVFRGVAVEGEKLTGRATLTHDFPAGPVVVTPEKDAVLPPGDLVVSWSPVTEPAGIVIVAYQVVVTREDPHREMSIDLPGDVTSVTLPGELLESATAYGLEVTAEETSGNRTTTEFSFSTN